MLQLSDTTGVRCQIWQKKKLAAEHPGNLFCIGPGGCPALWPWQIIPWQVFQQQAFQQWAERTRRQQGTWLSYLPSPGIQPTAGTEHGFNLTALNTTEERAQGNPIGHPEGANQHILEWVQAANNGPSHDTTATGTDLSPHRGRSTRPCRNP